jgi:hypothetical protein
MTVPAHAHNEAHLGGDTYEEGMSISFCQQWTATTALNAGGLLNVSGKYDPLRYLFYTANQVADHFPSTGTEGDNFFDAAYGTDTYAELQAIIQGLGAPPSSVNVYQIANTSFVTGIRCIAGLLHWFALETELTHTITVNSPTYVESGSGGGYRVNGGQTVTSWSSAVPPGAIVNVEAVPPGEWCFVEWSDVSQDKYTNPRVLNRNADVTLYAKFKKRFGSTLVSATGPSNQRKLAYDGQGTYQLVYESGSNVWHTKSTNSGSTWSDEKARGQGGSAWKPCVASSDYSDLFIVWQETDAQQVKRLYAYNDYYGTRLMDSDASIPDMQPVVAVSSNGDKVLLMYKKIYSGSSRVFYLFSSNYGETFVGGPLSIGTPIIRNNPSIVWNPYASGGTFVVSFDFANVVHLCSFNGTTWTFEGDVYYASSLLSPSQVSVDGAGRQYITWVALGSWGEPAAFVKSRASNGSWSTVTEFNSDLEPPISNSSVCGNTLVGGASTFFTDRRVLFNLYSSNGVSWLTKSLSSYGTATLGFPNLLVRASPNAVASIFTKNSTAPYELRFEIRNNQSTGKMAAQGQGVAGMGNLKMFRRIELVDTSSHARFSIQVGDMHALSSDAREIKALPFDSNPTLADSSFMRTSRFNLGSLGVVDCDIWIEWQGWKGELSPSIDIVDENTGAIVSNLFQQVLPQKGKTSIQQRIRKDLSNLHLSSDIYIAATVNQLEKSANRIEYVEVQVLGSDSLNKAGHNEQPVTDVPSAFDLRQNHPNPFNPSTTINYELPEMSHVTLKIFNTLGQEVASLVDAVEEPGYKSIEWNAAGVASGVYFYRLTAGDFVQTRKLLVLK